MKPMQARILTISEVETFRQPLLGSWKKATGLLRYKINALKKHTVKVR